MKNKEPIKISLPVFIAMIILLVAVVYGVFMYMQNEKLKEEIATVSNKMSQTQSENSELQDKLNNISNIATTNEKKVEEEKNSKEQESNTSSNLNIRKGEFYDLLPSIKETIETGGSDSVSGQVWFSKDGKVYVAYDVVREFEGTYTISGDTITCNFTVITNEGEKEKNCDYTVKYKILHNNGLEVLSSDLKYTDRDKTIYSVGEMLVCYR